MDLIDKHIIIRSNRAIKCLPFNSDFYNKVKSIGLSAENIIEDRNIYISDIKFKLKTIENIEKDFLWLIKIGVLRREVDGQGLTSKVRITPLGRFILEKEPKLPSQKPSTTEVIKNFILRKSLMT